MSIEIAPRVSMLSRRSPQVIIQALEQLVSARDSWYGQVLSAVVSTIPGELIAHFADRAELIQFVRDQPLLATNELLWDSQSIDREQLAVTITGIPLDVSIRASIIAAVVRSEALGLATAFTSAWGLSALEIALNTINSSLRLPDDWRGVAVEHQDEIGQWIASDRLSEYATVFLLVTRTLPISHLANAVRSVTWGQLQTSFSGAGPKVVQALWAASFLNGLSHDDSAATQLLTDSFVMLHDTAAHDELEHAVWADLEPWLVRPRRFWDWDRCDRLRRTYVRAMIRRPPYPEQFWSATDRIANGDQLIHELERHPTGRAILEPRRPKPRASPKRRLKG